MNALQVLIGCGAIYLATTVHADDQPVVADTEDSACQILKTAVAKVRLATATPDSYWYCELNGENNLIYIFALRSSRPRPDMQGAFYSNLVGWFAVAKRGDLVLSWDVAEDRLVPLK